MLKRLTCVAALLALLGWAVLKMAADPPASPANRSRMFKDSREALALKRVRGDGDRARCDRVRGGPQYGPSPREVARLGGQIEYRDDDISYLLANLPIDRVEEVVRLRTDRRSQPRPVQRAIVLAYRRRRRDRPMRPPLRPPPDRNLKDDNAYLDAPETGAPPIPRANIRPSTGVA